MKHTSAQLKQMARANLSNKWGIVIGFTLIQALIISALFMCTSLFQSATPLGITVYLIAALIVTLLTNLFNIGASYFYLNICRGREFRISDMFAAFKMNPDRFLIVGFILNLPSILFQIPGLLSAGASYTISDAFHIITRSAGYSMAETVVMTLLSMFFGLAYYLMLDFPEMGALASMRLSTTLMRGNKWRYVYMFTFSFIGLKLLVALSFGIGYLWITPYIMMTRTYFYCDVLEQLKHSDYMREYEVPVFKMPDEDGDFEADASFANNSAYDASYQTGAAESDVYDIPAQAENATPEESYDSTADDTIPTMVSDKSDDDIFSES